MKATGTNESNTKIYQFPTNDESYNSYLEEKNMTDDDITFENDSVQTNEGNEESFENINKTILGQIDEYNKSKEKGTSETSLVPASPTNTKPSSNSTKSNNSTSSKNNTSTKTKNYYYNKPNYNYRGRKNQTDFKDFVKLCLPTQKDLKVLLVKELISAGYTEVIQSDGFVYAVGNIPILLTAHMDTVHHKCIEEFYEYYDENTNRHIISSPQGIGGDDRCGIYMILQIIKTHKCSVLFCEDEESGGIGSKKFTKTALIKELENLKYMIELDRANGKDAVFYSCDNKEFTKFIEKNTGYKSAWGSFSDISTLAPAAGVAAVNLSCGYYNAHTTSEYVVVEEMLNTINVVKKLLDIDSPKFKYVKRSYSYGSYCNNRYYGYEWDDDDWYDEGWYYGHTQDQNKKKETKFVTVFIYLNEPSTTQEGCYKTYIAVGTSIEEAFGKFFIEEMNYCYADVYDYDVYDDDYGLEGWLYN